jgi:citrate synthase
VFDVIEALPVDTHPMTQFVIGIMAMQRESVFSKAYAAGMSKKEYWDYAYEDSMNLIARLPRVAAFIYRRKYKDNIHIEPDHKLEKIKLDKTFPDWIIKNKKKFKKWIV